MIKIHLNIRALSKLNYKKVKNQAKELFDILNINNKELELNFITSRAIKKINYKFRGKNNPTTILSFVASDVSNNDFILPKKRYDYLGEIFFCMDEIKKVALSGEISTENMMTRYLVHGILHLLGYKHNNKDNTKIMEEKEGVVLKALMSNNKTQMPSQF